LTAARPPKPMRADARRNCEHILSVAREVFTEQGADAPLDEIVKRAKVGAGTLYRHFPSRDVLLEQVYRAELMSLSERAHQLLDTVPPEQALAQWLREQVDWVLRQRGLAMSLKAAIDQNAEVFDLCRGAMQEAAAALLRPLQETGAVRADITAIDLLRLAHGVAVAAENIPPEQGEKMLSVVLNGLRP
jgi:AcrR family transcriptional regulator